MTIQQAINKSIEGGFSYHPRNDREDELIRRFVIMPLFFQALGKAMGWEKYVGEFGNEHGSSCDFNGGQDTFSFDAPEWKLRMFQLVDHLAEGKDIVDFFKDLN